MGELYDRKGRGQRGFVRPKLVHSLPRLPSRYRDYYREMTPVTRDEFFDQNYIIWDKDQNLQIESVPRLASEVRDLRMVVRFLYARLEQMENQLPEPAEEVATLIEEKVSIKKAKQMVHKYLSECFKNRRKIYPSDVADALGLSYETVMDVFNIFEREGKLTECK